jgi:hypothetical protein
MLGKTWYDDREIALSKETLIHNAQTFRHDGIRPLARSPEPRRMETDCGTLSLPRFRSSNRMESSARAQPHRRLYSEMISG